MFCMLLFTVFSVNAQVSKVSTLYKTLQTQDSLLFSVGFNNCDISQFDKIVSNDFEFYHDQAGITSSKNDFIKGIKNNLCGLNYKARRVLENESLEVYPLMKNGIIYGAVQNGVHRFYALETNKPEYFTSRARFTHVWKLENGIWKLLRGLSYDHQDKDIYSSLPVFDDSQRMNTWLKANNVPALAVGYIHNGQLQEVKAYGELDKGVPAAYNSIFNVASITKTITAVIALKLASKGEWDLDKPLYHFWVDPDIKADPRSRKITTRNILNQQSGFPNWRRESKTGKLVFEHDPGTTYQYSGEGFEYLRRALERKFHQPLNKLADKEIFKPFGMTDSRYTWDDTMDIKRFGIPHDAMGEVLPVEKNSQPNGADQMKTTITDYAKFLLAIVKGEGLSKSIAAQMIDRTVKTKDDRYIGLGWFIYDNLGDGEYAISHGGDDPGAHSIFFMLPKSGEGIIIFTNSDNGPKLYADLIKAYLKDKGQRIIDIEMK